MAADIGACVGALFAVVFIVLTVCGLISVFSGKDSNTGCVGVLMPWALWAEGIHWLMRQVDGSASREHSYEKWPHLSKYVADGRATLSDGSEVRVYWPRPGKTDGPALLLKWKGAVYALHKMGDGQLGDDTPLWRPLCVLGEARANDVFETNYAVAYRNRRVVVLARDLIQNKAELQRLLPRIRAQLERLDGTP